MHKKNGTNYSLLFYSFPQNILPCCVVVDDAQYCVMNVLFSPTDRLIRTIGMSTHASLTHCRLTCLWYAIVIGFQASGNEWSCPLT